MNDALPQSAFASATAATDISVILVGAQGSVLEAIDCALSRQPGLQVTLTHAPEQAGQMISRRGPFDVVLLDYSAFPNGGLDALQMLIEANGRGVAILGHLSRPVVDLVIGLGTVSYLPTTMSLKSFVNTIRFVAAGEVFLPRDCLVRQGAESKPGLTLREYKVLLLLSTGRSDLDIGALINIPVSTVKMINKSIFFKLGVKNRTQAALVAHRDRLC
jgi:two-component system, NarL family, nitrate/nitrite response regulator NarL